MKSGKVHGIVAFGLLLAVAALLLLGVPSCKEKPTGHLYGELPGADGVVLELLTPYAGMFGAVDSAVVTDGKFQFSRGDLRGVQVLNYPGVGQWLVYLSDEPTRVDFLQETPLLALPYGDTLNGLLREHNMLARELGGRLQSINAEYQNATGSDGKIPLATLRSLDEKWVTTHTDFARKITGLIDVNNPNMVSVFLLRQYGAQFEPEELATYLPAIEEYANNGSYDPNVAAVLKYLRQNANRLMGASAPSLEGSLVEGELIALDSVVAAHDYVLVNFWSLLNEASLDNLDSLRTLYSEFKGKGIAICNISVDADYDAVKEALYQQENGWIDIVPSRGGDPIYEFYNVSGLPASFLYGDSGRLIARDEPVAQLRTRLAQ